MRRELAALSSDRFDCGEHFSLELSLETIHNVHRWSSYFRLWNGDMIRDG